MTLADGRSSTRAFHAFQQMGIDESLRRARIQEGNTAELYGNGTAVDIEFSGEGRVLHQQQDKVLDRRASEGANRSGQQTSQQEGHRRGPMVRVLESRGIPTKRRLLTCFLDTVAVAWKSPFRRCSLYWRARCPEETKLVSRRQRRAGAEEASHGL